jgi:hypothetical protein
VKHNEALLRHFADLRDGTHHGVESRADKEKVFEATVRLLDPVVRRALQEMNDDMLLGRGRIEASGFRRSDDGVAATWALTWTEQVKAGVSPVTVRAHYGTGFHHPHLGGATVGEWPLNVFDAEQAEAELPTVRAIAAADLHNLVFQADYRIVPATTAGASD